MLNNNWLELTDGVRLELLLDGDEFCGVGEVSVGGVLLRSRQVPLRVHLATPLGVEYSRYTLQNIEGDEREWRVHLTAHGAQKLYGEICDDFEADLLFPRAGSTPVADRLTWIFKACRLEIDGQEFHGFSYALEFESEGTESAAQKIYRMRFESTWELGGSICGVTHLHQGQCNPPVYVGEKDTYFTSGVLKTLANPAEGEASFPNHSMQSCSRHGTIQAFDFQYSPSGVLVGVWERGEYVRTLIQKNTGEDVLFVLDEHHVEYSSRAKTCAKQILFAPIADELRARDLWKATKDHVQRGFSEQWNFTRRALKTEVPIRESWMGNQPGSDCWFGDRIIPSTELLKVLADEWMPQLKARGTELVGFGAFAQSDFTEMNTACKRDGGIHGEVFVSSVCNPWRYVPAEYWGGMKAWKYHADRAHELDLKVGLWIGCHMARYAPIMQEHPEWFEIGRSGKANMASLSNMLGAAINWNSGFRQWILDDLKRWRDEGGLDYIFIDSWGNIGMLPINYNDNYSNNLDGLGRFMSELEEAGFEYVTNEGMGPFNPPRFGLGTHQTRAEGQNNLQWWIGNEHMADGTNPIITGFGGQSDEENHARHFRFFANNALMALHEHEQELPAKLREKLGIAPGEARAAPEYYSRLIALWPHVRDEMFGQRRTTLPNDNGVLWSGGAKRVLWSYRAFEFQCDENAEQIYPARRSIARGAFQTEPFGVYLFDA